MALQVKLLPAWLESRARAGLSPGCSFPGNAPRETTEDGPSAWAPSPMGEISVEFQTLGSA